MDQISDTILTVDPVTGAIGANLTGHLRAAGVDLNASTVATPPNDQRVRWLDAGNVDGAGVDSPVGHLVGWTTNSFRGNRGVDLSSEILAASGLPAETNVEIRDYTLDVGTGGRRMVGMRLYDPTTGAIGPVTKRDITAFIRNDADSAQITRKILDSAGESDFLQVQKVNAKGDLYAGTGVQAFAMRSAGADETVLAADAAQATGLKYANRHRTLVIRTVQRIFGANSVAETSFSSVAMATIANVADKTYRLKIAGTYNHATAGGSLNLRLKAGAIILDSYAIAAPAANQAGQALAIEAIVGVRTTGAAGVLSGLFGRYAGGAASTFIERGYTSPAVDLTVAKTLDVTAQYGTSSAANGITCEIVEVEEISV